MIKGSRYQVTLLRDKKYTKTVITVIELPRLGHVKVVFDNEPYTDRFLENFLIYENINKLHFWEITKLRYLNTEFRSYIDVL